MSDRRRILLVTHSLSGGGAERFVSTLAQHLDRRRFEPLVVTATPRRTYPVPEDVPVSVLGYRGLFDLPFAVRRLRREIARLAPDVILSNVLSTNALTGAALAGLGKRPVWVARVGNAPGAREPWLQRLWARRVYPLARAVVANSRDMVPALAESYPAVADRIESLPNPTDFARLDRLAAKEAAVPARDGRPVLLWAGRLTRQKRPDVLLEAFARLRRQVEARLWLCGDGPLAADVDRQIERLGLAGSVERLGFCENPFSLMRQANLFLLTSDFEGLPNALIEAQGLGLPAVATRCPFGPAEIVEDGATGRLVPAGDAAAVADAALELLADRPRLGTMAAAARRRARELYALPAVLPRWEDLLLRAVESR